MEITPVVSLNSLREIWARSNYTSKVAAQHAGAELKHVIQIELIRDESHSFDAFFLIG